MSNYRVVVKYDPDKSAFVASVPELEHCTAEGATRAEALQRVEEELTATIANAREQGGALPGPVDDADSPYSGVLTVHVSRSLHRDLVWQARAEGIDLDQLLSELLPLVLDRHRARGRRPQGALAGAAGPAVGDGGGPRERDRDERRRGGYGQRYHAIMEDRATFLEYVRGLEQGGPPTSGPRGRRGGRGRGGHGSGERGGGAPGAGRPGGGEEA